MAIVDARGFNLTPDTSGIANQLLQAFQIGNQNQLAAQEKKETASALVTKKNVEEVGAQALTVRDEPNPTNQRTALLKLSNEALRNGKTENSNLFFRLFSIQDDDELNLALTQTGVRGADAVKLINEKLTATGAGQGGLASAKTEILESGATIQALPSGQVDVRNPLGEIVTGEERSRIIADSKQQAIDRKQKEADLTVSTASRVENVKQRQKRISDITKEQSERGRNASRRVIKLERASKLIEQATQGIAGSGKVALSRFFPGIDVADETALAQSMKQLAVEALQDFSGPTTDFEFGIVQDTTGSLGDSQIANRARVKALQRDNWFKKRETEQFKRFIKGKDNNPDDFAFNFAEPVKTKKGVFSLQDLQDTAVANHINIDDVIKRLNKK